MNIKMGAKFHNRFVIEVRDKDTGALKQKGVAENILLDRIYTRICNFNSYFSYIHFGSGTGTLTPDRTTLFSSVGYKSAEDEEKIKAYPVSSVTRRIRLEPEEYVGTTITEVGVSEATNAINTHALIKDAEGNPLSITKKDIDVIIIYATIFIELSDANKITFSKYQANALSNYFIDNSSMSPNLQMGDIGETTKMNTIGRFLEAFSLTRTVDLTNRSVSFSTRLGIDDGNYDIRELSLGNICRVNMEDSTIWSGYTLKDVPIGVGDGENKVFDIDKYDTSNMKIKIDGQNVSNYILENMSGNNREVFPLWKLVDTSSPDIDMDIYRGFSVGNAEATGGRPNGVIAIKERIMPVNSDTIVGSILEGSIRGYSSLSSATGMILKIDGSYDGETYESIASWSVCRTSIPVISQCTINYAYKYLKFTWYNTSVNANHPVGYINYIWYINPDHKRPQIIFDTPPSLGSTITVDYTVPYIPKSTDYILDVNFELQFGEGV